MSSYALGLGEINARSALNQNFDADINLLSLDETELDSIRISLASPENFQKAGVERPFFLSSLRFKAERKSDGTAVVRVSSDFPIREPFLNFLLEVNWPKGRLLREFTVLLDPPVTTKRRAPKVTQAGTSTAARESGDGRRQATAAEGTQAGPGEYGPVNANETLWSIARSTQYSGASMHQQMMGLFNANPQAFIRNNINQLKKGAILRVPSREEILSTGRTEAQAAYQEQQDAWVAARSRPSTIASTAGQAAEPAAQLRIAAAYPEEKEDAGAVDAQVEAPTGDAASGIDADLLMARENAESARLEAEGLRDQVDDLRAQLDDLQRLLTLKDDQLAQMQANLSEGKATEQPASSAVEPTPAPEKAETPAPIKTTPPEPVKAAEPPKPKPVVKPAPLVQPDSFADEPSFLEENLGLLLAGGGVVAVLAVLLLLRRRNAQRPAGKQDAEYDRDESILLDEDGESASDIYERSEDADTSFLSEFSSEDLTALQEETSDVNPVAEADVYIAYGRYQQAEELLRQVLDKDPGQREIKHKLLEVYYATRDKEAFAALAYEMTVAGDDKADPAAWQRVQEMGRKLDADNALYSGESATAAAVMATAAAEMGAAAEAEEDEADIEQLASDLAEEAEVEAEAELNQLPEMIFDQVADKPSDEEDIALELDGLVDELDSALSDMGDSEEASELDSLDMDDSSQSLSDDGGLDTQFADFNLDDLGTGQDESEIVGVGALEADVDSEFSEADLETQMNDLSDELGSLEETLSETPDETPDDLSAKGEELLSDGMMDEPLPLDDAFAALEEDEEESDLNALSDFSVGEVDEVETKLALARAYQEMGDPEGAREILGEVEAEGNEQQQAEAARLLAELNA